MNFLCCNIALPCAIILSVASLESSPEMWRSVSAGLVIILVSTVVQIVAGRCFFRKAQARQRVVYQMGMIYGNSAYMGIPIVAAVVGSNAVIYVTLMLIFDTVFLFTHASLGMTGERPTMKFILSKVFGPITISMLIGLAVCVTGIEIPSLIHTCMTDFRGMLSPLAMLIIGTQLAGQDFVGIFKEKIYYAVAAMKLVVWPLLIMLCLYPLRSLAAPAAVCAIVICKATPQAAVFGVVADNNGLDGQRAAGVVGVTTLLSVVTLPIIAGICTMLFG